jgi:hypothetical protein
MLVSRSEYSLLQLFTTLQELESTILVLGAVQGLTYLLVGLDIQVAHRLICLKKISCQMIELICTAFLTTIGVLCDLFVNSGILRIL